MEIKYLILELEEGQVLKFTDPEETVNEVHCLGDDDYDLYLDVLADYDPKCVSGTIDEILENIYDEGDFVTYEYHKS